MAMLGMERRSPPVVLILHMPGCGWCKQVIGPKGSGAKLKRAIVLEIDNEHPLVSLLRISSFPAILLCTPTRLLEYAKGERDSDSLQAWIDAVTAFFIERPSDK